MIISLLVVGGIITALCGVQIRQPRGITRMSRRMRERTMRRNRH